MTSRKNTDKIILRKNIILNKCDSDEELKEVLDLTIKTPTKVKAPTEVKAVKINESIYDDSTNSLIESLKKLYINCYDEKSKKKKSFVKEKKTNEIAIMSDDTFMKIDNIKMLKTNLFEHQKVAIKSMLDLEQTRSFETLGNAGCVLS